MFLSGLIYIYQLDSVDTEKLVQRTDNSWSGGLSRLLWLHQRIPIALSVCVCVSYQSSPCAESLAHSPESQEIVVGGRYMHIIELHSAAAASLELQDRGILERTNWLTYHFLERNLRCLLGLVWLGLAHPPWLIEQVGRGSPLDTFSFTFYSGRML
jgi:hypothetical protein